MCIPKWIKWKIKKADEYFWDPHNEPNHSRSHACRQQQQQQQRHTHFVVVSQKSERRFCTNMYWYVRMYLHQTLRATNFPISVLDQYRKSVSVRTSTYVVGTNKSRCYDVNVRVRTYVRTIPLKNTVAVVPNFIFLIWVNGGRKCACCTYVHMCRSNRISSQSVSQSVSPLLAHSGSTNIENWQRSIKKQRTHVRTEVDRGVRSRALENGAVLYDAL